MPKFALFPKSRSQRPDVRSMYLVGVDGVPVRGDIRYADDVIVCETHTPEALGLSLLWEIEGFGRVQLETTRLPPRDEPYNLHAELARHRLMRISTKREEWGLYDYPGMNEVAARIDAARDRFVQSLAALSEPERAARLADEALAESLWASEELCGYHAAIFLGRRQSAGGLSKGVLGATVPATLPERAVGKALAKVFDFVRVPLPWREIQPEEKEVAYDAVDACLKRCAAAGLPVRGGPLLNFGVQFVPDWMFAWESDYEAIASFAREHVRRTVQRYASQIGSWIVASGLHADNVFPFNFEQIMDMTRLAVNTTRQAAPRAHIVLDLVQPWGEYYARNQRSIPPLLYAEMAQQSGIAFDAFGVQFLFGIDAEGYQVRDFMQVSSLIDRLAGLGKPLHITAVAVPSTKQVGGTWRRPWSEETQAEWLTTFGTIALSKPYVESVCLCGLTDSACAGVPSGGVLRDDLSAKLSFEKLAEWRRSSAAGSRT